MQVTSVGRRIQRFEVTEQLGVGGMGSVFRAWDPQLERDVAIKVLSGGARDPSLELSPHETLDLRGTAPPSQDDLLSEARMMARLSHPNVLPVYEVGLDGGVVFVVMEHIDGSNLRQWLEQPREQAAILAVFAQAGRGLAAAHARGIVHRDFKPENVLIGSDGRARVADFGLSQLSAHSPAALLRIDDGRGTPRYMAPELWHGERATAASDVFAFCTALSEALGDEAHARGVPARLRAAIAAGTAEDPARRPDLPAVLAAIEGKTRSRWWLAGAGAALAAAAAIVAVVATRSGAVSCDDDPRTWQGRWGEPERARVQQLLARDAMTKAYVEKMIASLDGGRRAIDDALRGTCRARAAGEISEPQARTRASCIERRAIELGAVARWIPVTDAPLAEVENKLAGFSPPTECATLATTPLPADRAPITALYDRYTAIWSVHAQAERIAPLAEVERAAAGAGELELELRAGLARGVYQRATDDLASSDATLQRVYQRAVDLHANDLSLLALVERATTLVMMGRAEQARDLTELAATQTDGHGVSARTRARAYSALGSALVDRADYLAGIQSLQKALDVIAADGHRMTMIEIGARFRLIDALVNVEERVPAGIKLARDTVEFARARFGEHFVDYGTALNKLAYALTVSGDSAGAIPLRRQAIAVFSETMPADHSSIALTRGALASDLYGIGEYEEARQIWQGLREISDHNETLRANRAGLLGALGEATFYTGRFDEGLELMSRSIDEMTAQYGPDHHWTQGYRRDLAVCQIETGHLDDAARSIAALEKSYARKAESPALDLARLHGTVLAELELVRGKPHDAEQLTRAAIGAWDELHGDKTDRAYLWTLLGWELSAQQRWDDARAALVQAKALARTTPPDEAARIEARLARVDFAQGHRAEALAEATHASEVLAHFPGWILARKDLASLLASLGAPAPR